MFRTLASLRKSPRKHASSSDQMLSCVASEQLRSVAGSGHSLTTGQVLEKLAVNIASHHNDLFKSLLKQMCVLTKSQTKTFA